MKAAFFSVEPDVFSFCEKKILFSFLVAACAFSLMIFFAFSGRIADVAFVSFCFSFFPFSVVSADADFSSVFFSASCPFFVAFYFGFGFDFDFSCFFCFASSDYLAVF